MEIWSRGQLIKIKEMGRKRQMTECNGPSVIVQITDGKIKLQGKERQAEGMIKLKGVLKLTVWRPKALYMLTALVKNCLLTTFACISE